MIEYDRENGVINVSDSFSREYVKDEYNRQREGYDFLESRELTEDELDTLMERCVAKFENLEAEYCDCEPNYYGGVQSVVEDFIEELEEEHNENENEK